MNREVLERGYLSEKEVARIARDCRMPKYMYDTSDARQFLSIFAQHVRRRDVAEQMQTAADKLKAMVQAEA